VKRQCIYCQTWRVSIQLCTSFVVVVSTLAFLLANETSAADYTVIIKTNATQGTIPRYLTGAVGDVITKYKIDHDNNPLTAKRPVDNSPLLGAFGISHMRLHDTRSKLNAFDAATNDTNAWYTIDYWQCDKNGNGNPSGQRDPGDEECTASEYIPVALDLPGSADLGIKVLNEYYTWNIAEHEASWADIKNLINDSTSWKLGQMQLTGTNEVWSTCDGLNEFGIDVMLRVGEDQDDVTYYDPHPPFGVRPYGYAQAFWADAVTTGGPWYGQGQAGVTPCGAPAFIDIHNEPDGSYFTGPNWWDEPTWAQEWNNVYQAVRRELKSINRDFRGIIGGPGFTNTGFRCYVEGLASGACPDGRQAVQSILDHADPAAFDWISFHLYPEFSFGDALMLHPETKPRALFGYLEQANHKIDLWDGAVNVPIHITEYRLGNSSSGCGDQADANEGESTCTNRKGATFVTALLSWMSWPEFHFEGASFFSTHFPDGLFYAGTATDLLTKYSFDLATEPCVYGDPTAPHFMIRKPAMALKLMSRFLGMKQVPTLIESGPGPKNLREAALANYEVTGLSGYRSSRQWATIVTNYSGRAQTVEIKFDGLGPRKTYHLMVDKLTTAMSERGCAVQIDTTSEPLRPSQTELNNLMADLIDTKVYKNLHPNGLGVLSHLETLDEYSFIVLRLIRVRR
jgi:hypothetical protein